MAYRDPRLALEEKARHLEQELAEAREEIATQGQTIDRLRVELDEARRLPLGLRLGRGLVYMAAGAVSGLAMTVFPASATGKIGLLVPGVLIGALFGGLYGLMQDLPSRY